MLESTPSIDMIFHALANPSRRAILDTLSHGPVPVSSLPKPLNITLAAVVQHLQILEDSGLTSSEKIGRVRTCRIESSALSLAEKWIAERRTLWEKRYDKLGELLDAENDD